MKENYYVGAYWGCRPESAEQSARRAETFFRLMAASHSDYARWFEQAKSTKRALELEFEPSYDTFKRFFEKKRYQFGSNGFSFAAWTGHVKQEQGGMVMIRCGSKAMAVPNSVLLYFPSEEPGKERLLTVPVLTGIMRAMALAWEPDWAIATTDDLRKHISRQGEASTFVGWLTYVTHQWGEVPPLPEPVRVEPVEDKGSLIVLAPERLTAANPEHVALGHRVQQRLEECGLLRKLLLHRPF